MKNFLIVSTIALGAALATAAPASAHVYLGIGGGYFGFGPFGDFYDDNGPYPFYGPYYGGPYYDSGYGDESDYDGGYVTPYHAHYRHCRLERVSHLRHHHRVVERVRVCG